MVNPDKPVGVWCVAESVVCMCVNINFRLLRVSTVSEKRDGVGSGRQKPKLKILTARLVTVDYERERTVIMEMFSLVRPSFWRIVCKVCELSSSISTSIEIATSLEAKTKKGQDG